MKTVVKTALSRMGALCVFILVMSVVACQPESVPAQPTLLKQSLANDSTSVSNALPPKDVSGGQD